MPQAEHPLPQDFFLDLDRSSPTPLYFQIATKLEAAISDGTLPAGARLENEISLGQRFGLSRPTMRRAIQELVDKGLLEKGELDRRTNVYTVTQRGQREIEARREWETQYLGTVDSGTA